MALWMDSMELAMGVATLSCLATESPLGLSYLKPAFLLRASDLRLHPSSPPFALASALQLLCRGVEQLGETPFAWPLLSEPGISVPTLPCSAFLFFASTRSRGQPCSWENNISDKGHGGLPGRKALRWGAQHWGLL